MNTDKLIHEAHHCNDPERLRELANLLDYWSETDEAEKARERADKKERKQAERACA